MNTIKLIRPSNEYAHDIAQFKQELLDAHSDFAGCGYLRNSETADEWIKTAIARETTVQEGGVPSNSYLAVRLSDNKIVGIIDLRHHIDHPILSVWGGHIGYTIRPCERQKGYAKQMLYLNLQNCRNRGLKQVLLVCNCDNIASEKTILANGGVFEKEICVEGNRMKRYWIAL